MEARTRIASLRSTLIAELRLRPSSFVSRWFGSFREVRAAVLQSSLRQPRSTGPRRWWRIRQVECPGGYV